MRIYLLNPPFHPKYSRSSRWAARGRGGTLYYPIWLAYATGILEESGNIVRLVDAPGRNYSEKDVYSDVLSFDPDIVVAECNFQSLQNDIKIAKQCAELCDAISIIVGPPCSLYHQEIVNSGIDFVIQKEYDLILNNLITSIDNHNELTNIQRLTYIYEEKIITNCHTNYSSSIEIDYIPFVSKVYKKHLEIEDYFLNHAYYPMVQILTSRGCPNLCTFCSWPETLMGRKYRSRSVDNIYQEFEYIKKELPEVKEIVIEDDTFTINKQRVQEFCLKIINNDLDISWGCQSRGDLDYDTMVLMKKAGCSLLDVGYESGSIEILSNIKKGITKEQLQNFTKNAKKARIKILADFVIGFPGETKDTINETIEFINQVKPELLQVAIATPIPGTEFFNWSKEHGYLLTENLEEALDRNGFQKCIISYPWLNNSDIEENAKRIIHNYYFSIFYLIVVLKYFRSNNVFEEIKLLNKSIKSAMSFWWQNNESG